MSLPKDIRAAHDILSQLASQQKPKAMYTLAHELLVGTLKSDVRNEGGFMLEWAAKCGSLNAVLAMAKYHQNGSYGFHQTNSYAFAW